MYIKDINKLPERVGKELSPLDVLREMWYRTEADRRLYKQLRSHIISEVTNLHRYIFLTNPHWILFKIYCGAMKKL